jgi:hypothetical protein
LKISNIIISVISILLMLMPLVAAVYPVPAPPADKFPIYFGIYLLVGIAWFVWLRFRANHVVDTMRSDLASVHDRFDVKRKSLTEEVA